jgi:hypothetical protein
MIIKNGIARIKEQLGEKNNVVTIPLMKAGQSFTAKWDDRGVSVDNLGNQPLSLEFPLDSIEGCVAHKVFKIQPGKTTYRKISAIVGVLSWAGICTNGRGYVTLNQF